MFWPRGGRWRWLTAGAALCCCLFLVVTVKLFSRPCTVSLNYIEAQSPGSLLGVALFWLSSDRYFPFCKVLPTCRRPLMVVCWIYTAALLLFFLFSFDFALSTEDFRERAAALPHMLLSWPGEGRSTTLRVVTVLADAAATVPLGLWLAPKSRRRCLFRIAVAMFAMMSLVTVLTMLVGRWFQPRLQPDFSDAVIAAVAAGVAVKLTPAFWSILASETIAEPRTPGGIAPTFVLSQHGSPRIPDFGRMIRGVRR